MNISKTIEEKQNKFLNRKELKVLVEAEKVPNKEEAKKLIAKKENKPEENTIIERIKGKFGRKTFLITAKIYDTKEDKEKIERKKETKKGEEEKKEEKPVEKKEEIAKPETQQAEQKSEPQKEEKKSLPEKRESKENKQEKEQGK